MSEISERRRRIAIRVAITETFMAVIIVILVIFFAMLSMGYNFNLSGGIEHTGLLQISSTPSASVTIDDETLLFPTTQSKTLVSGPHDIKLKKDGYTSWSKTISVTEGLYYRLTYPRLYLKKRESKTVPIPSFSTENPISTVSISKDRKFMLLILADNTWQLLSLNDSAITPITLPAELSAASWRIVEWSDSSNRILAKSTTDSASEWILIDLNKPEASVNLTKELAMNFSNIRIMNPSASELWALTDGQLRLISIDALEISKILAENVTTFSSYGAEIAYVSTQPATDTLAATRSIYLYQSGADTATLAYQTTDITSPLFLALSHYYEDDYLSVVLGDSLSIYYGSFPAAGDKFTKKMPLKSSETLSFAPEHLSIHGAGELIIASAGSNLAIFDTESFSTSTVSLESAPIWVSDFDIATFSADTWLTLHDFDGTNPYAIAEHTTALSPVISENDKYFYYFTENLELVKETIK